MTIAVSPDPSSMSTAELKGELEKRGEPTCVLSGRDELEFCVKSAREKNSSNTPSAAASSVKENEKSNSGEPPQPSSLPFAAPCVSGHMPWYYTDLQGKVQGPYSQNQMKLWFDTGT